MFRIVGLVFCIYFERVNVLYFVNKTLATLYNYLKMVLFRPKHVMFKISKGKKII